MKKYLTTKEAAEILRCSPVTLRDWRYKETGPPFHKVGARSIVYIEEELHDWVSPGQAA